MITMRVTLAGRTIKAINWSLLTMQIGSAPWFVDRSSAAGPCSRACCAAAIVAASCRRSTQPQVSFAINAPRAFSITNKAVASLSADCASTAWSPSRFSDALQPHAIGAAIEAIENVQGASDERVHQKALALEQAHYEVDRAQRRYDVVDPAQRLVAAELERRWNEALKVQAQIEQDLAALKTERPTSVTAATKAELLALAEDLPCLWDHPGSSPQIKKRLLRTVLKDIIATSEDNAIRLVLHWQGGDHTELRFEKNRTGKHRYVMDTDTIELIRSLARIQPDSMIASILNRMGRHTPHGQTWTAVRVCATRNNHAIAVYREGERQTRGELNVSEVAAILSVTQTTVLRMIRLRHMPATQACVNAPWVVRQDDLDRYLADHRPAGKAANIQSESAVPCNSITYGGMHNVRCFNASSIRHRE
jgi:hypothetical protein